MIKAPKIKPIDFLNNEKIKMDEIILIEKIVLPPPTKRLRT